MASMVNIGAKPDVERRATARGEVLLQPATIAAIRAGKVEKGDPIHTAEVAGLQAIKRTAEALPHCHPIPLTHAAVRLEVLDAVVRCTAEVAATYKTGVEMEALHGCAIALLTVWDMVKSLEKDVAGQYPLTLIRDLRVTAKEKT
jgi:cyclic pyranopterin phosphate synthase